MDRDTQNYFIILTYKVFQDKELTAAQKLLYGLINSLTNKYGYFYGSNAYLAQEMGTNEDVIKRHLKILEDKGLVRREVIRDSETNQVTQRRIYTDISYPRGQKVPQGGGQKVTQGVGDKKSPIESVLVNTYSSNNKDTEKSKDDNPPKSPPKGKACQEAEFASADSLEARFTKFWEAYPATKRKANKQGCLTALKNIDNLDYEFPRIMAGLELWKNSSDWTKDGGQYIPAPLVFLHQRKWEGILEEQSAKRRDDMEALERLRKKGAFR